MSVRDCATCDTAGTIHGLTCPTCGGRGSYRLVQAGDLVEVFGRGGSLESTRTRRVEYTYMLRVKEVTFFFVHTDWALIWGTVVTPQGDMLLGDRGFIGKPNHYRFVDSPVEAS